MKVFVLYEMNYGELATEIGGGEIIEVYDSYEKARKKVNELVAEDLKANWVLDEENFTDEKSGLFRLFYNKQENWNDYYELIIEEREVI